MSANTSIEWTDRTWNPVRGCALVSDGCRHCYAMKVAHRFSGAGGPYEGLTELGPAGPRWTGKMRLVPEALEEPLRWRTPRRIFVNSMSDLFHEDVPDAFIDQVFAVMALTPRHTFQILTKRPERMRAYMDGLSRYPEGHCWEGAIRSFRVFAAQDTLRSVDLPLRNVWLGVSAENQATSDERIPLLLQTPAAVRFVSAEPLLGPINFTAIRWETEGSGGPAYVDVCAGTFCTIGGHGLRGPKLDWVIVGGESGPGARPCAMPWLRAVVEQCRAAHVPVFVKQLGARPVGPCTSACGRGDHGMRLQDRKGGDPSEWPKDLRVREFPVRGRRLVR